MSVNVMQTRNDGSKRLPRSEKTRGGISWGWLLNRIKLLPTVSKRQVRWNRKKTI